MAGCSEAKKRYYERNRELVITRSKEWRENNREKYNEYCRNKKALDPAAAKVRARFYAIKRKYGITPDQYDELLGKQNHRCAVCERHEDEFDIPLAVDHSHKTGIIRGLLCTNCNHRLVARHEDGTLLRKAAEYVEQGTDWVVPSIEKRTNG